MSLPDLLEGDQSICHSEDKDILRQGDSQQALQQSCEGSHQSNSHESGEESKESKD